MVSLDYLDRIVDRYKHVSEFARQWRPYFFAAIEGRVLAPGVACLVLTDWEGKTSADIRYALGRPDLATTRYAALKYGYIPAKKQVGIRTGGKSPPIKITLRRDTNISQLDNSYWRRYFEIQQKFSGNDWKESETEDARNELISIAQTAEKSGHFTAAARIYSWIPFIPTSTTFKSSSHRIRMSGFQRENERSTRNISLLKKAFKLDPKNRYIRMKLLLLQPPANQTENIQELEALIRGGRNDLWPEVFIRLEKAYYAVDNIENAKKEFLWFRKFEPDSWRNQPEYYKVAAARYVSLDEFKSEYLPKGNPNQRDQYYHLPIFYALSSGRVDIFNWLLINNVSKPFPPNLVMRAVLSEKLEILHKVLNSSNDSLGDNKPKYQREMRLIDDMVRNRTGDIVILEKMRILLVSKTESRES